MSKEQSKVVFLGKLWLQILNLVLFLTIDITKEHGTMVHIQNYDLWKYVMQNLP